MPRSYRLSLGIREYWPEKEAEIMAAVEELWTWDGSPVEVDKDYGGINAYGDNTLPAGVPARQSEREYYRAICESIWAANGSYCRVYAEFINLEDGNHYDAGTGIYNKLLRSTRGQASK